MKYARDEWNRTVNDEEPSYWGVVIVGALAGLGLALLVQAALMLLEVGL